MKKFQYIIMGLAIALVGCNNSKSERAFSSIENNEEISEPAIEVYVGDPNEDVSVVADDVPSDSTARLAQQESQEVRNIYRKFKLTDYLGHVFTITLKYDKTVLFEEEGKKPIYGSWNNGHPDGLELSFYNKYPIVYLEKGPDRCHYSTIRDGYLYPYHLDAKSKDPETRIKVTEIQ